MFSSHIPVRACLVAAIMLTAPFLRDTHAEITAERARDSIERGIRYLQREQHQKGNWDPRSAFTGGVTALCTLALLEAGVPADDPTVRRALNYLRRTQTSAKPRTYTVALRTMVYCRVGSPADKETIKKNIHWLESNQITSGKNRGAWGYPEASGDPSNTQFALLALHEAALTGFDVRQETWRSALGYWQRLQDRKGSWGYPPRPGRGSMTCAGIASVIIANSHLSSGDANMQDGVCVCGTHQSDEYVKKGLDWLGRNFSVTHNPSVGRRIGDDAEKNHLYYLYAMERVGRIAAKRFFYGGINEATGERKKHDWYREGAAHLLNLQNQDGHWTGGGFAEDNKHIATSFALLFLAKGRRPVLISKLQRSGNDWNRSRHDMTQLTRYTERKWKMPMTWQVIDAKRATADDYTQTPVLFLSGSESFKFTELQRQELRRYVEQGGFIFADGCCGDAGFDASLRNELAEIFPEDGYQLQPLDAQHPIWSIDEKVDLDHVDPDGRWLWGINFACKTSVVYCPGNLSCFWELSGEQDQDRFSESVQREINTCRAIGVNVLAYATNRRLKTKLAIPSTLAAAKSQDAGRRGHFAIAKLQHSGGCDAAPRAMTNLMEAVAHSLDIHTDAKVPLISLTDAALFDYSFVYMHGRHDFRLGAQEKRQLKTFVDRGGTVLADAICASPAFAKAFRREMLAVFKGSFDQIETDDPLLTAQYGGTDLNEVVRRESVRKRNGAGWEILQRRGPPLLEGLVVDGRFGLIFSPFDLSCALEKHVSPHCRGYTTDDAARIAINVILYSLHE